MTAHDKSTEPPLIWRLLFTFVFLEYLNNYICFIFFTNILVYKLLFFIVVWLSLHLDEFMRVFHFLMPVSMQQYRVDIGAVYFAAIWVKFLGFKQKNLTHSHAYPFLTIFNNF